MEEFVDRLYADAGFDPSRPQPLIRLVDALGDPRLEFRDGLETPADTITRDGRRAIRVRIGMSPVAVQYAMGHELGHLLDDSPCEHSPIVERRCNRLGVACACPRAAMHRLRAMHDLDVERYAEEILASQTMLAIRWGEVYESEPSAVVAAEWIVRRGPAWLPPDAELRRIVAAGGAREARIVRLTDQSERWLVVANG